MDILDILLDILLKPPQPFIGLFFYSWRMLNDEIEMVWKATLTKVPEILKICLDPE